MPNSLNRESVVGCGRPSVAISADSRALTAAALTAVLSDPHIGFTGAEMARAFAGRLETGSASRPREELMPQVVEFCARLRTWEPLFGVVEDLMNPRRYPDQALLFDARLEGLNDVLAPVGARLTPEGTVRPTHDRAPRSRLSSLRAEATRRGHHRRVFESCTPGLLFNGNLHAAHALTDTLVNHVRSVTGIAWMQPGGLLEAALRGGRGTGPFLAVNGRSTVHERAEQTGLLNTIKGLLQLYRVPPKSDWRAHRVVDDQELIELIATVSLLHTQLDRATVP